MNPLPLLLALIWPGCGQSGADGIAIPPPFDMTRIERPATPNHALAGPVGKSRQPVDVVTAPYPMPPDQLFAIVKRAMAFVPRTILLAAYEDLRQIHYVIRSPVANFPDIVSIQVEPGGIDDEAFLTIFSRSVHGRYDFKANLRRLHELLAEIAVESNPVTRKR